MKTTRGRRRLSLLLTLAMCLTLAPAAWAAEVEDIIITDPEDYELTINRGKTKTIEIEAAGRVAWESEDETIATVNTNNLLTAHKPGETEIVAFLQSDPTVRSDPLHVIVSGIDVTDAFTISENETKNLMTEVRKRCWGDVDQYSLEFISGDTGIVEIDGNSITGRARGETTVEIQYRFQSNSGSDRETLKVVVEEDPYNQIEVEDPITTSDTLSFRDLDFSNQMGGKVKYITGLFVPTDQGILYYGYHSEAEPGRGVGQVDTYYTNPSAGQWALDDITFVPKSSYPGGEVTITYTAVDEDGQTCACRIVLTVKNAGSNEKEAGGISLKTPYNTAVHFDSIEFGAVCREKGTQLDYVIFSQPPERQGTLYTNYSSSDSFGSVVDIHRQYSRREIDDVWFVPAPGYSGSVTVYYTAFATNGESYSGQVHITVEQENMVATGGLSYNTSPGKVVRFNEDDFDKYCYELLYKEQTLSGIRFEFLPDESDGILYYDYQSAGNTGDRAEAGTVYYYGARIPRINRLVFVPAEDFTGTLRLPFTGWTMDGTSFSGTVEINVRGGSVSEDIYYYCTAGRSVSFVSSDFTNLSRTMTNRTLDYIRFRGLPDASEGSLYYGSSRISSTGASYRSSNLSQLSFRASNSFSGLVNIPFELHSTGDDTFYGVITIGDRGSGGGSNSGGSNSGGGSGNNRSRNIHYTTDSSTAAVFYQDDFNDLSLWETDRSIRSVRFDLPSSSQGTLYQNYRTSSSMGTQIASGTSITASNLDRVAFVPASGYTGTVYISFTGSASGSGGTFSGTVEVEVGQAAANATARYSTRTAPVRFYADDLAQSGSSLSSIRFTSLPSSDAGYLYYQYSSPAQKGRQVSAGTTYQASGSNLISDLAFVPRAGYSGTVIIPYTGTNSSGATFSGKVEITVSPAYSSSYFSDMADYSSAQLAAVDFLYDNNITRGLTTGQYGPESSIRRGDFALMLYQAFAFSPTPYTESFMDVSPDVYYATAVDALHAKGVVSGIGDGYYAPDSTLTRQDAICMVQRAMQAAGWSAGDGYVSALAGYSDSSSVSGYAQGAMAMSIQRGFLPTAGSWLNPQLPLTRVDMAEILHRVLTY